MLLAGEGTPTQAVILGALWVVWSAVAAIWPRQSLLVFERHRRWRRGGSPDWPVPQVQEEPKQPTERAIAAHRIIAIGFLVFGLALTVQGVTRL